MAINSHDKVKPWLQGQLGVFVAEYLEAIGVVAGAIPRLLDRLSVQPPNKSIKRTKHHEAIESLEGFGLYKK
jgi:hypothetical protein